MFVVTFYSFKGGVGRTLALVNTAVALARAGRRVLAVDFDLEAPGLPSHPQFEAAHSKPGVVDYINAYRRTNVAPAAGPFIVPCEHEGATVWVMPAGLHTGGDYSDELNSIDWEDLYANRSGYLLFEDLKQQWEEFEGKGFDYVLVDSRTGHTDVGGICTRQLPDAVVIMFLPTQQNVEGLVPIVDAIRAEKDEHGDCRIDLLFCPSNVPDLDDYEGILQGLLGDASLRLGYHSDLSQQPVATIHNYSSLHLLRLDAFAVARPNSRLAREYEALLRAIISRNYEDPQGATAALEEAIASLDDPHPKTIERVEKLANKIRSACPTDPRVALLLGQIYGELERIDSQIASLTVAIDRGVELPRALLERARAFLKLDRRDEAAADLKGILAVGLPPAAETLPAVRLLQSLGLDWLTELKSFLSREDVTPRLMNNVAQTAMSDRRALPVLADALAKLVGKAQMSDAALSSSKNSLVLSLIGSGRFESAMRVIGPSREGVLRSGALHEIFNYAIAEWGTSSKPPEDLFLRFEAEMEKAHVLLDANNLQCRAVAQSQIGNFSAAKDSVVQAQDIVYFSDPVFSCWRYLEISSDEMAADLETMSSLLNRGDRLEPPFLKEMARDEVPAG